MAQAISILKQRFARCGLTGGFIARHLKSRKLARLMRQSRRNRFLQKKAIRTNRNLRREKRTQPKLPKERRKRSQPRPSRQRKRKTIRNSNCVNCRRPEPPDGAGA